MQKNSEACEFPRLPKRVQGYSFSVFSDRLVYTTWLDCNTLCSPGVLGLSNSSDWSDWSDLSDLSGLSNLSGLSKGSILSPSHPSTTSGCTALRSGCNYPITQLPNYPTLSLRSPTQTTVRCRLPRPGTRSRRPGGFPRLPAAGGGSHRPPSDAARGRWGRPAPGWSGCGSCNHLRMRR